MSILVLTTLHRFVNPTRELLLSSLGPEFVVAGPGYGSVYQTIAEYERHYGRFDGVVMDGIVYLGLARPDRLFAWPDATPRTFADLFDRVPRLVVLNLLDDFHGSTAEQFRVMFDPRVVVLSTTIGADNFRHQRFIAARREGWMPEDISPLPRAIPDNYLLFPASLGDDEFATRPRRRDHDVAVLGVQYYIRRRVAALLKAQGVRVITGDDWRFRLLRAINGRTGWLGGAYRGVFLRELDRVRIAVTCSGTVGYPIRKFLEIPARRAALVAEFFDHPEALGFRPGQNCVAIEREDAADAPALIASLLGDEASRQRIADAGFEMVWSRHRVCHRVLQLREIVAAIAAGDFRTTRWVDGRQQVVRASEAGGRHSAGARG